MSYRGIIGAFRLLRRRAAEVGRPALAVWADAGEFAAERIGRSVQQKAHADEICDLEAEKELQAGLKGLRDGRVDREDLAHLARAARNVRRSAKLAHEIGELVR
jgi:hypothetical protein